MNDLHQAWSDAPESSDPFDNFKAGKPEAFRHFFRTHHYRIYCFLLRQAKERRRSRELTHYCFIVLFRNCGIIRDQKHMLRVLYILTRIGLLLQVLNADPVEMLEAAWKTTEPDDVEILEDPDVTRNETLNAVQQGMRELPSTKRELAKLYFFQGMTIQAIAQYLGIDEIVVREHISQMLKRLVDELADQGKSNLLSNVN
jgi:RNA polymerase sigma factor (sigma-70 family)